MENYKNKKFISDGTWFDEGTEAECLSYWDTGTFDYVGIFKGIRTCKNPKSENKKLGEKYIDEELCTFDEFIIRSK